MSIAEASEAERYAAAWRDRKRRFVIYVVALNSFWILILFGFLSQIDGRFNASGRPVFVAFTVWFVGQIAAGVWLNRFRCPGCGNLFYWKWSWQIEKTGDGVGAPLRFEPRFYPGVDCERITRNPEVAPKPGHFRVVHDSIRTDQSITTVRRRRLYQQCLDATKGDDIQRCRGLAAGACESAMLRP